MITVTDEMNKWKAVVQKVWSRSLGVVLALLVGLGFGWTSGRGDITEDCKYSGAFRVGSQAFTCVRKI